MSEEKKDQNVKKSKPKDIQKLVEKLSEKREKQRNLSKSIEYIKEGYQPSDILDISNPPSGNPPSDSVDKTTSKE